IAQIAAGMGITTKILELFNMHFISLYTMNARSYYVKTYVLFLENFTHNCLVLNESILFDDNHFKFLHLINYNQVPIIQIVRDPFKRMATVINHVDNMYYNGMKPDIINNKECLQQMFDSLVYPNFIYSDNDLLIVSPPTRMPNVLSSGWFIKYFTCDMFLKYFNINKCIFVDLEELNYFNLKQTVCSLAKILSKTVDKKYLDRLTFENLNDKELFWYFPLKIKIDKDIQILLERKVYSYNKYSMLDITDKVLDVNSYFKEKIVVTIHDSISLNDTKYQLIKSKLSIYLDTFLKLVKNEIKNNYKKPLEIIEYMRHNKFIRYKIKNKINSEICFLKQHRPDIVASWKYYQEFEKMCEELDEKEDSLKENISNN
ncbi:DUF2972 domain-containing protein, partial [Campylobacter insulaenigrae]|uniref:DUF2972 domain-containing protein n=1 Tax=Campylobacter insulaenigrae TaxID=260714 RepID=UPI00215328F7